MRRGGMLDPQGSFDSDIDSGSCGCRDWDEEGTLLGGPLPVGGLCNGLNWWHGGGRKALRARGPPGGGL